MPLQKRSLNPFRTRKKDSRSNFFPNSPQEIFVPISFRTRQKRCSLQFLSKPAATDFRSNFFPNPRRFTLASSVARPKVTLRATRFGARRYEPTNTTATAYTTAYTTACGVTRYARGLNGLASISHHAWHAVEIIANNDDLIMRKCD